ncbi:U-box domain-containing protein 4 [Hordeum vulgare]|nr:U-box domain-containing protein 4 [Hordeum vulgare]
MPTYIGPFIGSGISVFNSSNMAFFAIAFDSLCSSFMPVKFEQTSMVFSNLVRSLSEHPRKNALYLMPQGKGSGMGLGLGFDLLSEFMSMDLGRLKLFIMQIDNESKGKEVVPPKEEDKDKYAVSPSEVTPVQHRNYDHYHEVGGPTNFWKVIIIPRLEAIPMVLDFTKHFTSVPQEFKLKTDTDCFYRVTVRLLNGRVTLD